MSCSFHPQLTRLMAPETPTASLAWAHEHPRESAAPTAGIGDQSLDDHRRRLHLHARRGQSTALLMWLGFCMIVSWVLMTGEVAGSRRKRFRERSADCALVGLVQIEFALVVNVESCSSD